MELVCIIGKRSDTPPVHMPCEAHWEIFAWIRRFPSAENSFLLFERLGFYLYVTTFSVQNQSYFPSLCSSKIRAWKKATGRYMDGMAFVFGQSFVLIINERISKSWIYARFIERVDMSFSMV